MSHKQEREIVKGWKRYLAYKDSGVEWLGDVPESWEIMPIKFALSIPITDGPHETPELHDEGIPFISAESIKNDRIDFDKKRGYISLEEHKRFSRKYKPQYGDVYMVKSGATTGNVARVETNEEFNIWSPLAVLRPNTDVTTTNFLFYAMKSKPFFYSVELSWSFGTQQNIGMGVISNIRIVLPPLPEQQAIAQFLDRETTKIDTLIAKKERLIELLKEKRTALISHAVTKGLNPDAPMKDSGVEWLGEVPEGWEVKRLKFLLTEPLKYGANESAELDDRDCPRFIRITDISDDGSLKEETFRSLPEDVAKPFILKQGDILFARSGATVGKSFMYREHWGVSCHAGYLIRARLKLNEALPEFVSYFANSSVYWDWISSIFIQATIQNVSAEKYANLWLATPETDEQLQIAQFLDRETAKIDTLIAKTRTSIDKLKEYRTALISAAVTGKIDIREEVLPQ